MSGDAWYPKERRLLKKNMLYHEGKSKVNNFLLGDLIIGNVLAIMGLTLLERMLQKIHRGNAFLALILRFLLLLYLIFQDNANRDSPEIRRYHRGIDKECTSLKAGR